MYSGKIAVPPGGGGIVLLSKMTFIFAKIAEHICIEDPQ
jgi:hypothetical protein